MSFLNGKKTYIVAIGGVLTAVGGVLSGSMDINAAILLIVNSLMGATIRSGISNQGK